MRLISTIAIPILLVAAAAPAQQSGQPCTPPGEFVIFADSAARVSCERVERAAAKSPAESDPLATHLFPPELIMAHQGELGLQDSQRAKIIGEIQKAQAKFVELQWTMSAETARLEKVVEPSVADEAQVLEQVDRTLAVEREIKRLQVTLLVRIKNALTPGQQAKLAGLRNGNGGKNINVHVF